MRRGLPLLALALAALIGPLWVGATTSDQKVEDALADHARMREAIETYRESLEAEITKLKTANQKLAARVEVLETKAVGYSEVESQARAALTRVQNIGAKKKIYRKMDLNGMFYHAFDVEGRLHELLGKPRLSREQLVKRHEKSKFGEVRLKGPINPALCPPSEVMVGLVAGDKAHYALHAVPSQRLSIVCQQPGL